ncbi:MAG: flagellar hook-associated protein FlgK [Burkholderiaceae bacterium]
MSSSISIGANALVTNQSALQVIGHNIANVNTTGYSRQRVELETAGYQFFGSGYFGKGVSIDTVSRAHDAYLTREARLTSAVAAADAVRLSRLQQLESAFPLGTDGLGASMNDMLNAWSDVSSSPSNLTARVVAIASGDEFASRMRNTAAQLDMLRESTQQQVQGSVDTINRLASDLASINQRIIETQGSSHTPNDLLDQRDQLLRDISQYVQTSVVPAEGGSVSVFVAGSQPLVLGARANTLAVTRDPSDTSNIGLSIVQSGSTTALDTSTLGGGELSGLMRFLTQDLTQVQNLLGRMALSTATLLNQQQSLGLDLQGQPGGDFFVAPAPAQGIGASTNTGDAQVSASVIDATALRASDYELRFDAIGVSVVRLSDGQTTDFPGPPATFDVDGLQFSIDAGSAADGDVIRMRPYEAVARNLQMALTSPDRLAAASPVTVVPETTNSGGLSVESLYAVSAMPDPLPTSDIEFQADGTYTIDGAFPGTPFTPGVPIEFNGWSLTLRGSPSPGDRFTIEPASAASVAQNGGNADAVLALRSQPTFEGVALADGYISLFSDVGTRVQGAQFAASFSGQVASAAETARTEVSGVNLDEEAARLLQFQQAYQASAKFLQVAQSTFDSLLQTVGR